MSDEDYVMTLRKYVDHDLAFKENDGHKTGERKPMNVIFVSTLRKKKGVFEEGQEITQWYKISNKNIAHSEELRFSMTYGDYYTYIDSTLTQTCEKPSITGKSTVKGKDE